MLSEHTAALPNQSTLPMQVSTDKSASAVLRSRLQSVVSTMQNEVSKGSIEDFKLKLSALQHEADDAKGQSAVWQADFAVGE